MTHPGTPRDVDLDSWLDGIGFHPADTMAKQVGHQVAREFVANMGAVLHELLPAGRDKAMVFIVLEDVLLRANRALALGGGPADQSDEAIAELAAQVAASPIGLPRDRRYEAEQRGEVTEAVVVVEGQPAPQWRVVSVVEGVTVYDRPGGVLLQTGTSEPVELSETNSVTDLMAHLLEACKRAWPGGGKDGED